MNIAKKLISLVFLCSCFANLSAQIAITKLLVFPAGEYNEEVWFKLNAPAFPESLDTLLDGKKRVVSIKRTYSDGSFIDSLFNKKGQLDQILFQSNEDKIEIDYIHNELNYVLPNKWGIADSSTSKMNFVKHGKTLEFSGGELRYVRNYRWGKLVEVETFMSGRLTEKIVYMKDRKDYMRMEYFDNGKVLSSVRFLKGKVNGTANYYFNDGSKLAELHFKNDLLIDGKIYKSPEDKEGLVITKGDPDVMWQHCAPDGSFCCECHTRYARVKCVPIKTKN